MHAGLDGRYQVAVRPSVVSSNNKKAQEAGEKAEACGEVLARGLAEDEKLVILEALNLKRTEIASGIVYDELPPAADMARLVG